MIPSVNFHLWEPCNMRCKFCFATFQDVKQSILPKGHLSKKDAIEVVIQLAEIGFEKITFAGGEPVLCPWLPELIKTAKDTGLTTMIVTNGSKLTDEFLEENKKYLDWIAISVDSLKPNTNFETGRAIIGKVPLTRSYYYDLADRIKKFGYGLKINTVVNSKNFNEKMSDFISYAKPKRWKLFQVLPIKGQNDFKIDDFKISDDQFQNFISNHNDLKRITTIVPESNNQMKGSYAMVDPAGRFFDNTKGKHNYSRPILEIGSRLAIQQVNYDFTKFISRGGIYNWSLPKNFPKKITLSGKVASGKSSVGKLLAEKLNYQFYSIGNKTREYAKNKGLTIVEFQKECLKDSNIDKLIDTQFTDECNQQENLVVDYRLGFNFIKNAFHIYLNITNDQANKRLLAANRANESHFTIKERNETFKNQFQNAYQLDYTNTKHYNLTIEVSKFKTPEEIADFIINQINKKL